MVRSENSRAVFWMVTCRRRRRLFFGGRRGVGEAVMGGGEGPVLGEARTGDEKKHAIWLALFV